VYSVWWRIRQQSTDEGFVSDGPRAGVVPWSLSDVRLTLGNPRHSLVAKPVGRFQDVVDLPDFAAEADDVGRVPDLKGAIIRGASQAAAL
jgi:hypothetical protein